MIGYHNSNMISLIKSIKTKEDKTLFPIFSEMRSFTEYEESLQKEYKKQKKTNMKKIINITMNIDAGTSIIPYAKL